MQDLNNVIQSTANLLNLNFFENIGGFCEKAILNFKTTLFNALRQKIKELDNDIRINHSDQYLLVRSNQSRTINMKIGKFKYKRNQYRNIKTNQPFCIDELLGIQKYSRTPLCLKCLAADFYAKFGSFQKAADAMSGLSLSLSHQTIFNYTHSLNLNISPDNDDFEISPRLSKHIYIEADEDHINLYRDRRRFSNIYLIYLHEGYETISKNRRVLKHPLYFSGDTPSRLWKKVKKYIAKRYPNLKSVSIHGDGATWIRKGCDYFKNATFYLDKFHAKQAARRIAGTNYKLYQEIISLLEKKDFHGLQILFLTLNNSIVSKKQYLLEAENYLLNMLPFINFSPEIKCSAEGHVSHVLSSILSSRPKTWKIENANRIAKIRAWLYSGFTLMDLYNLGYLRDTA